MTSPPEAASPLPPGGDPSGRAKPGRGVRLMGRQGLAVSGMMVACDV